MSLNGLDDVKVQAAHDAANAEPGGWSGGVALIAPACLGRQSLFHILKTLTYSLTQVSPQVCESR
ncbi:hypothetical protein GGR50DRAFT_659799 [Xylaria sp. CBS 124048]|nr:hypothetical protein GGR50DRAFT_659799 [Xylaria sp. CBS 124048]